MQRLKAILASGKPYCGKDFHALQGPARRHRYFKPALAAAGIAKSGPVEILEIGSWAGVSALTWAWAARELDLKCHITCIDPWKPYFNTALDTLPIYSEMNEAADSIYELFRHNTAGIEHLTSVRAKSCDVLPAMIASSCDLIYIDGSHEYEDVRFDMEESLRLIRNGGIICGDDLEIQRHELPADDWLKHYQSGRDYVQSQGGPFYHPGVTEAVAVVFGKVSCYDGFWCMRGFKPVSLDLTLAEMPPHLS